MSSHVTRRSLLRALGGMSIGIAGCLTRDDGSQLSPSPTTETTTDEPTTYGPTSGPDERVTATPPGDPALSPSGTWPEFRFDAGNTGYNPSVEPPRDATEYWRLNAGGPPVLDGETLYNVHGRGRETRALVRRDPATMAQLSTTPLVQYGINGPPVLADGAVFVTTFIEVFCLSAARDEVLWRGPEMDGIHSPPAVGDGAVVVSGGGFHGVPTHLRAFERADGTERWRYPLESDAKGAPAIADGAVFAVTSESVHAVELATGERRFRIDTATSEWTTPVATQDAVYVVNTADELLALSPDDGTELWHVNGTDIPVVADDVLYVPSSTGGNTVARTRDDGSEVTTFDGRPRARAGQVLVTSARGRARVYDIQEERELWEHQTPEVQVEDQISQGIYDVVPVEGAVYVVAADGFHGLGPAEN